MIAKNIKRCFSVFTRNTNEFVTLLTFKNIDIKVKFSIVNVNKFLIDRRKK